MHVMHAMHRMHRMLVARRGAGSSGAARRGGVARASRFHVQSPDKDAARISVHAYTSRYSGK